MLVSACSSAGGGDWVTLLQATRAAWEGRNASVGLDQASHIPYATLGVRINEGAQQILILALDDNGERLWTSSARVAIATSGGRIVRTAGFGTDLNGFSAIRSTLEDWSQPHAFNWEGDFSDLGYYSVSIHCDVRPQGPDPITILGQQIDTIRVDELCHSDKLNWSYTNSYWVSLQSGRVWRSVAHFHPKGPALELEILRPPLSPG